MACAILQVFLFHRVTFECCFWQKMHMWIDCSALRYILTGHNNSPFSYGIWTPCEYPNTCI
jgi:hypothetical protein